jgi:hypothetical protein
VETTRSNRLSRRDAAAVSQQRAEVEARLDRGEKGVVFVANSG